MCGVDSPGYERPTAELLGMLHEEITGRDRATRDAAWLESAGITDTALPVPRPLAHTVYYRSTHRPDLLANSIRSCGSATSGSELKYSGAHSAKARRRSNCRSSELALDPHLLPAWHAFRETRAQRRAVDWLVVNSLIDDHAASRFLNDHPDPDVP